MALITSFDKLTVDRTRVQPTQVECRYGSFERNGQRYLVLETSGSDDRKMPGKVSQTMQLNAASARELGRIRQTFPEPS
jgi:hypothetical protein